MITRNDLSIKGSKSYPTRITEAVNYVNDNQEKFDQLFLQSQYHNEIYFEAFLLAQMLGWRNRIVNCCGLSYGSADYMLGRDIVDVLTHSEYAKYWAIRVFNSNWSICPECNQKIYIQNIKMIPKKRKWFSRFWKK